MKNLVKKSNLVLFSGLVGILVGTLSSQNALAIKLRDYPYYEYQVRFTNPKCKEYRYSSAVYSNSGKRLYAKPQNVFCTRGVDTKNSINQKESPHRKLVEWIRDPETKEIFFAALSFRNNQVLRELCRAVEKNGVKVTFVLSDGTDLAHAERLQNCQPKSGNQEDRPRLYIRGHEGGIGYAHNKLFVMNPRSSGKIRIAFGSGNVSDGLALHHENWHFVTTHADSYFAQAHKCLIRGVIANGKSKSDYSSFIRECRSSINTQEESDIKVFFVPGQGSRAMGYISKAIERADRIDIAAHRFMNDRLIDKLRDKLDKKPETRVRLVTDDDTYWVGHGDALGDNEPVEYDYVQSLVKKGAQDKYMETNHWDHLLHHNKFLVFNWYKGGAVFAGAGNLTDSAFSRNYENFYFIRIPEVVKAFNSQYRHLWEDLATWPSDLPSENIAPRM